MFNYKWHGICDVLFVYEVKDITTNAFFSVSVLGDICKTSSQILAVTFGAQYIFKGY